MDAPSGQACRLLLLNSWTTLAELMLGGMSSTKNWSTPIGLSTTGIGFGSGVALLHALFQAIQPCPDAKSSLNAKRNPLNSSNSGFLN